MNELDKFYFVERKKKFVAGNGITPKRGVKGHFCGGWWRANNNKSIRDKLGNPIGSVMSLTYFSYKNSNQRREESIKTDWIMHKFKLKEDKFQECVLCRIRDGSKRINKKLTVGSSENLQLQISPMNTDMVISTLVLVEVLMIRY
ncbi:NAC transcription factor 29-like [Cornus florida]|uniref:NAC transcription factor 29-like n=1 Tax=Cornus florida TaxID=4283 RepID=UPI00289B6E24|nr:NAC transcription factor 29-like [Cornus florida]